MAVPTLVQSVATSMSSWTHGSPFVINYGSPNLDAITTFNVHLPNNTLSNNLLVAVIYSATPSAGSWGITDNIGNTWTVVTPVVDATNATVLAVFYKSGATAGVNNVTFTVSSSGHAIGISARVFEFYNVTTSSALNTSNHANATSNSWACGSITPGVSGCLLFSTACQDNGTVPSNRTLTAMAGGSWALLEADVVFGIATQMEVYNSTTAINPTITMGSGTALTYLGISLAFASAAAGTAPTVTPRVVSRKTFFVDSTSSQVLQIPGSGGNLRVAVWDGYTNSATASTITLSDGTNTWTSRGTVNSGATTNPGSCQILDTDAASTTLAATNSTTLTANVATYECELRILDIQAPFASGNFDSTAGCQTANGIQASVANLATVSITPSTSNGLVVHELQVAYGTVSALVSPPAGTFLEMIYSPQINAWATTDSTEENNGFATTNNASTSAITYTWTYDAYQSAGVGPWSSIAAAYKGSSVANTLSGLLGTYSETGKTSTLVHQYHVDGTAADGLYTSSGKISTPVHQYHLTSSLGTYSEIGKTSTPVHQYHVDGSAASGVYSETGKTSTPVHASFLVGALGVYAKAGKQAGMVWSHFEVDTILSTSLGTYAESGIVAVPASLRHILPAKAIYAESGSGSTPLHSRYLVFADGIYVDSGAGLATQAARNLIGMTPVYVGAGKPAVPAHIYALAGLAGSYAETGFGASPVHARFITEAIGLYSEAGSLAVLNSFRHLISANGVYSEVGFSATLKSSLHLVGSMGLQSEIGEAAFLVHARFITEATGVYSESGKSSLPVHAQQISTASGAYSESGEVAFLVHAQFMVGAEGIYSEFGESLSSLHAHYLVGAQSVYSGVGESSTFTWLHFGQLAVICSQGIYTEENTGATLKSAWNLPASLGVCLESGELSSAVHGHYLAALDGSHAELGFAGDLLHGFCLATTHGVYTQSGISSSFTHEYNLVAIIGLHVESGAISVPVHIRNLASSIGLYSEIGESAILKSSMHLIGMLGLCAESGIGADLTWSHNLGTYSIIGFVGSYAESSFASVLKSSRHLQVSIGSHLEAGGQAVLAHGYTLHGVAGSYVEAGIASVLMHGRYLVNADGSYSESGDFAVLESGIHFVCAVGSYHETGHQALLNSVHFSGYFLLASSAGYYEKSGGDATFQSFRHFVLSSGHYLGLGFGDTLVHGYCLSATTGVYSDVGFSASLPTSRLLVLVYGAYAEFGAGINVAGGTAVSAASAIILRQEALAGIGASSRIIISEDATAIHVPAPPRTNSYSRGSKVLVSSSASSVVLRNQFTWLGRFRHGDKVTFSCSLPGIPDSAPIAVVFDVDPQLMGAYPLSSVDSTNLNFSFQLQMSLGYQIGTYLVSYQYTIGGIQGVIQDAYFQVIPGGDAAGEVIFMYALDRPEATFVLTQLNSGRLCVGRNPSIGA